MNFDNIELYENISQLPKSMWTFCSLGERASQQRGYKLKANHAINPITSNWTQDSPSAKMKSNFEMNSGFTLKNYMYVEHSEKEMPQLFHLPLCVHANGMIRKLSLKQQRLNNRIEPSCRWCGSFNTKQPDSRMWWRISDIEIFSSSYIHAWLYIIHTYSMIKQVFTIHSHFKLKQLHW